MLKTLTLSDFSPIVGSSFQVRTEPEVSLELELLEAVEGASSISSDTCSESFSLLFKGPKDITLPQQICPMSHSDLGELNIFLVPVACEVDGMRYEAIFN